MSKCTNKTVTIYVKSEMDLTQKFSEISRFPESENMPIDAVKKMKTIVDSYLSRSDSLPLLVETVSTDIVAFLNDYGELKGYTTKILYNNKEIGLESMFEQFNTVFNYIDKVTNTSDNA